MHPLSWHGINNYMCERCSAVSVCGELQMKPQNPNFAVCTSFFSPICLLAISTKRPCETFRVVEISSHLCLHHIHEDFPSGSHSFFHESALLFLQRCHSLFMHLSKPSTWLMSGIAHIVSFKISASLLYSCVNPILFWGQTRTFTCAMS